MQHGVCLVLVTLIAVDNDLKSVLHVLQNQFVVHAADTNFEMPRFNHMPRVHCGGHFQGSLNGIYMVSAQYW